MPGFCEMKNNGKLTNSDDTKWSKTKKNPFHMDQKHTTKTTKAQNACSWKISLLLAVVALGPFCVSAVIACLARAVVQGGPFLPLHRLEPPRGSHVFKGAVVVTAVCWVGAFCNTGKWCSCGNWELQDVSVMEEHLWPMQEGVTGILKSQLTS